MPSNTTSRSIRLRVKSVDRLHAEDTKPALNFSLIIFRRRAVRSWTNVKSIPEASSRVVRSMRVCIARGADQMMDMPYSSGHVENRGGGVTLFAKNAVASVMRVVLADVVFASE